MKLKSVGFPDYIKVSDEDQEYCSPECPFLICAPGLCVREKGCELFDEILRVGLKGNVERCNECKRTFKDKED
ncbi:MAG TPA: hypothetical protein VKO61_01440 [Candidatus Paceibacterota bacterium]|nr:hypothetical protein [Candidatus Paceibacterota bacterium]